MHRIVLAGVFVDASAVRLVHRLDLSDLRRVPAGAVQLSRRDERAAAASKEFLGFPIPAAAGLVASLTLFLLWIEEKGFSQSKLRFALPVLLLFLSAMMVSEVKYPSFKSLDFRAKRSFFKMLIIVLCVGFFLILWENVLPVLAPRDLHGVSALRFCAPVYFARLAAGH